MSETDSDLDFESADEDADFVTNTKRDVESEKCTKKTPTNRHQSSESAEVTNISISEVKKSSKETTEEDKSIKISTEEAEEHVPIVVNEIIEKPIGKNQTIFTEDSESKCEELANTNKEVTNITNHVVDESKTTNATAADMLEARTEHKVEPEFHQKSRVVLRIEKKKQQKSQFSKEASVEKEKASDLVNILREEPEEPQFSWGFSSWGTSLLSSAASSVSTFSSQVSQGIETVFETVENTLGAPAPEELATTLNDKKKEKGDGSSTDMESENDPKTGLLPDVSSWTKVLENTGSKVLFGGLDTLELIGKKTMDMLTEGDPGLRKKRAVFSDKVNIAELLREARAKAEEQDLKDGLQEDSIHYSQIFDEKQGLVHLEALEMLSNQSQVKLQRLLMRHSKNIEVKKMLEEIKSICENMPSVDDLLDCENFEDFETVFKKHTLELSLPLNIESMMKVQKRINDDITKYENTSEDSHGEATEVFQSAIYSLAEFTAKCIETFHKVSELIIVQSRLHPDVEHYVTNLTGLTTVMCIEVNNISTRYHKCLDITAKYNENEASSEGLNATTMATNLYVEAANSNKYIQDAYLMLVPVLQVCFLEILD